MTRLTISSPEQHSIRVDFDRSISLNELWGVRAVSGISAYRAGTGIANAEELQCYELTVWCARLFDDRLIAVNLIKAIAKAINLAFADITVGHGDRDSVHLVQAIQVAQRLEGGDAKEEFAIGEGLPR